MKLYIGASSAETSRAIKYSRAAAWTAEEGNTGIQVVSRWPYAVEERGFSNPKGMSTSDTFSICYRDLCDLKAAEWLWILMPPATEVSAGAFWEFGFAYANNKYVCISGPNQDASVFTSFATVRFNTDDEALKFLIGIAK